jgi:hypothetical protein
MKRFSFSRRIVFPALLAALTLVSAPAFAGNADKLNGAWVAAVEPTLDLLAAAGALSGEEERAEAGRELATLKVTFDIAGKTFIGEHGGRSRTMRIDAVTENPDGSVFIQGEQQSDTYRFQADGTVLVVNADIVLRKVE